MQHLAALASRRNQTQHAYMKTALLAILAASISACVTDPDQSQRDAGATDNHPWLEKCGTPPQIPHWSYTLTADSSGAVVPIKQWDAHVAWSVAIESWSNCVDSTRF